MKTYAIINQKGGVGKTTTAEVMGYCLASKNKKVLFIDLDPQANLTYSSGQYGAEYNILDAPKLTPIKLKENVYLIPSNKNLAYEEKNISNEIGKEYRVSEAIAKITQEYKFDYVIIDTPPTLNLLTINALTCADNVIIPTKTEIYDLQGVLELGEVINGVKKYTNNKLKIAGLLLTLFNNRSCISRELQEEAEHIAKSLKTKVFKTKIRQSVAIKEAQVLKTNVLDYAPRANATQDYLTFIEEL